MQSDIVGQVLSVQGSPTRNGGTKFDVAFSDGNSYSTFDGALATKAQQLVRQPVSARIEQKPSRDGQRMFLNLVDVAPQGQLAAALPQTVPMAGQPVQVGAQGNQAPAPNIPIVQPQSQAEKDAKIAKGVAVKVAAPIVAGLFQGAGPEALSEALECFDKVGQHVLSVLTAKQEAPQAEPQVVPAEQTPQAVAAAVNEAAGSEVVVPWGAPAQ